MSNREPRKVFMSYSWTSPEQQNFVQTLAERLMDDGINVILDIWDLNEGDDKYEFMEKMVTDDSINNVLIISDHKYAEKADGRLGGVGTESQIISSEIYEKASQSKFLPIVTEYHNNSPCLPTFLKSRLYFDFSSDDKYREEYEKLVRSIYEKPLNKKPNLGTPPSYITEDTPSQISTIHKFQSLKDALISDKPLAKLTSSDFLTSIHEKMEELVVSDSKNDFDEDILKSIESFKPYRDQLVEYFLLVTSLKSNDLYFDQIFSFFEKSLSFYFPPESMTSYNELWFDNYKFIVYELYLYFTAVLIKTKRFDIIKQFTSEKYIVSTRSVKEKYEFVYINTYLRSLDEYRNNRLNLRRLSVQADLLNKRSDIKEIDFEQVMQADFVLALISIFTVNNDLRYWFPRSLVYKTRFSEPFDLFFRAETSRHFDSICELFDVKTKQNLADKLEQADKTFNLDNWRFNYERINIKSLMNLENLYNG